jgi:hypothetical protein
MILALVYHRAPTPRLLAIFLQHLKAGMIESNLRNSITMDILRNQRAVDTTKYLY